tara:strand:- start:53 stop:1297 length:1245 start_codon:yes stop_codon:yes gene_type:complete
MANSRISKKPKIARQYEISQQKLIDTHIDQGGAPDVPAIALGPDIRPNQNRANITSKNDAKTNNDFYLGLEAIDEAIFYYFENIIKPSVISNGDMVDVPVIYGSGERWKLAQKDGFYRDKNGKVQTPLVMLKRESIEKRRDLGNKLDANAPQLYITHQEKYTRKNSYDRFAILNNKIPQKEFTATVVPDYVNLTYNGIIWTDYISQLNKIIEAVNYASDSYWGDSEKFKFMAMIDSFNNINELSGDDGRIVRANFSLKLQGYIVPDNVQKKLKEQNTRYFSKAQIVLNQATTVIEEPSKRATTLRSVRGGTGGGGSVQNITNNNLFGEGVDDDWSVNADNLLVNNQNRNISIESAYLQIDIANEPEDIFLIKKNGNTKLKVNNDGVLVFTEFNEFPSTPEGGLIYMNNNFYFGI